MNGVLPVKSTYICASPCSCCSHRGPSFGSPNQSRVLYGTKIRPSFKAFLGPHQWAYTRPRTTAKPRLPPNCCGCCCCCVDFLCRTHYQGAPWLGQGSNARYADVQGLLIGYISGVFTASLRLCWRMGRVASPASIAIHMCRGLVKSEGEFCEHACHSALKTHVTCIAGERAVPACLGTSHIVSAEVDRVLHHRAHCAGTSSGL